MASMTDAKITVDVEYNTNPFQALLYSRKFWLLIMDMVISLAIYYGLADTTLIAILQPVFLFIIGAIAHEDAAEKSAATINNVQADRVGNVGETQERAS